LTASAKYTNTVKYSNPDCVDFASAVAGLIVMFVANIVVHFDVGAYQAFSVVDSVVTEKTASRFDPYIPRIFWYGMWSTSCSQSRMGQFRISNRSNPFEEVF